MDRLLVRVCGREQNLNGNLSSDDTGNKEVNCCFESFCLNELTEKYIELCSPNLHTLLAKIMN